MNRYNSKGKIRKQAKINRDRATRAALCLEASEGGYETGPGIAFGMTDLITDLLHLCDRNGLDFDDLCDSAAYQYAAHLKPDEFEQDLRRMYREGTASIL